VNVWGCAASSPLSFFVVYFDSRIYIRTHRLSCVSHALQNLFVHFEPLGHSLLHHEGRHDDKEMEESLEELYHRAWKKLKTKCVDDDECRARVDHNVVANARAPHYILPGSEEEGRWLQAHPKARFVSSLRIWHKKNIVRELLAYRGCIDYPIVASLSSSSSMCRSPRLPTMSSYLRV
jgi:hypothetical protein